MKSNFGATILTISGKKSGDRGYEDLLVDPVFLGWEKGVSVMDQVTSIAKKWLGKHGYMGLTSALEYFTQKRTKLLKAQHSDRSWSGQELSSRGGIWIYNSRLLATGQGKVEGIEAKCLDVCPGMFC